MFGQLLTDRDIDNILDRLEIRVRKVLADYGITEPNQDVQGVLDSLPRQNLTPVDLEKAGQNRIIFSAENGIQADTK